MNAGNRPVRRARIAVAVVALPLIAAIAVLAFWPRTTTGTEHLHATGRGAAEAQLHQTAGTPPALGGGTALEVPPDSPVGSTPETSLAEAAGAPPAGASREGAAGLGDPRPPVDPAGAGFGTGLGGCHDRYGSDGQCLPVIPPSQAGHAREMLAAGLDPSTMSHPWSCAELRSLFPDGIAVRTPPEDPLLLDSDGDGIACGSGD